MTKKENTADAYGFECTKFQGNEVICYVYHDYTEICEREYCVGVETIKGAQVIIDAMQEFISRQK